MKKLLVTGASGFLGWNVAHFPHTEWRVIGTWNLNKKGIKEGLEKVRIDLTNRDQLWSVLKAINPDAVLHLAAISGTNYCEKYPQKSYPINVLATQYLTEFCHDKKLPLLVTSSGQVFDGLASEYHEVDLPTPMNLYGKQKVEAENFISTHYPEGVICRVPVMFGQPSPSSQNFANNWLENWKKNEAITAFYDETRSFLSGQKAAEGLFLLIDKRAEGIFHLGGKEALTRVEFAELMKDTLKLPQASIVSKSQKDIAMAAYRPPKVVFKNKKINALGFDAGYTVDQIKISFQK